MTCPNDNQMDNKWKREQNDIRPKRDTIGFYLCAFDTSGRVFLLVAASAIDFLFAWYKRFGANWCFAYATREAFLMPLSCFVFHFLCACADVGENEENGKNRIKWLQSMGKPCEGRVCATLKINILKFVICHGQIGLRRLSSTFRQKAKVFKSFPIFIQNADGKVPINLNI